MSEYWKSTASQLAVVPQESPLTSLSSLSTGASIAQLTFVTRLLRSVSMRLLESIKATSSAPCETYRIAMSEASARKREPNQRWIA
jgi:hypothetical protein